MCKMAEMQIALQHQQGPEDDCGKMWGFHAKHWMEVLKEVFRYHYPKTNGLECQKSVEKYILKQFSDPYFRYISLY